MRYICLLLLTFNFLLVPAKQLMLLPYPQQITVSKNACVVSKDIQLITAQTDSSVVKMVNSFFQKEGFIAKNHSRQKLTVKMITDISEAIVNKNESYRLRIRNQNIVIEATAEEGVFNALQTLHQLITVKDGRFVMPAWNIVDWPAFRVRGFMHDIGRDYIPVEELKKELELLSCYKINVFQWHLTEDIAWRLESKRFPALNDSSIMTRQKGKFYTQAEVRDVINFCQAHCITLIPEIDMPGHSAAFTRAFHSEMQSSEGLRIMKQVMDEVCDLFAGVPYIHIGTDEVKFTNSDFVPAMVAFLHSKGKKVISWTPGWPFKKGEIEMTQLWSDRGTNHPVGIPAIDSRYLYMNHFDAFADIASVFFTTIGDKSTGSDDDAGAIAAIWNDRIPQSTKDVLLQNSFYPAMLALAERCWRGGGMGIYHKTGTLMPLEGSYWYKQFADFENRMLYHKAHDLKTEPFPYVRQSNIRWKIIGPFPNKGDLSAVFPPEISNNQRDTVRPKTAMGATVYLRHTWGNKISPAFFENPQPNSTTYATTWVYSPVKQMVGALAEFQNYGRSESDLAPPSGKWDYKESRVWVNGQELIPPVWENNQTVKTNEISLKNENAVMRQPIPVTLNKGWNKILLKLPVGEFVTSQVRLVKWMFTFVLVTLDAKDAVNDIVYSPEKKF